MTVKCSPDLKSRAVALDFFLPHRGGGKRCEPPRRQAYFIFSPPRRKSGSTPSNASTDGQVDTGVRRYGAERVKSRRADVNFAEQRIVRRTTLRSSTLRLLLHLRDRGRLVVSVLADILFQNTAGFRLNSEIVLIMSIVGVPTQQAVGKSTYGGCCCHV